MPNPGFQFDAKEVSNDELILHVSGELCIENSALLRDKLSVRVMNSSKLTVVVEKVQNIDLSFIQMLIALIRHRNQSGKLTYVDFDLEAPTFELLEKTGAIKTIYSLQSKN